MALHNEIGHLGEDATCEYLKKNGYKIVERNWRLGNIEIDVIAEDRRNIVFVEVKTRTTTFADASPEEYVDEHKRRFMTIAGNAYVKRNNISKKQTNQADEIHYYEDAFTPKLRSVNAGSYSGEWKWHRR